MGIYDTGYQRGVAHGRELERAVWYAKLEKAKDITAFLVCVFLIILIWVAFN